MPPYRPDQDIPDIQDASWREIGWMMRVILEILAGPMIIIVGALVLFVGLFMALTTHVALALIPIGLMVLGVVYLARRAKKAEEEALAEIEASRMPRTGRQPPGGY
ncbi:MAG: hypothetical protein DWG83_01615 [Chloroflexi bacterium]|nr:hypothetical protein [Chloroflexota bacterium]